MEFLSISNPTAHPTGILLTVTTPNGETGPFLATSSDPEGYGRDLFTRAMAGEFGEIAPYVAPSPPIMTDAEKLSSLQAGAMEAIEATDTVALRCLKNGVEFTEPWRVYYQSLLAVVRMEVWIDGSTLPDMPIEYPAGS